MLAVSAVEGAHVSSESSGGAHVSSECRGARVSSGHGAGCVYEQ